MVLRLEVGAKLPGNRPWKLQQRTKIKIVARKGKNFRPLSPMMETWKFSKVSRTYSKKFWSPVGTRLTLAVASRARKMRTSMISQE